MQNIKSPNRLYDLHQNGNIYFLKWKDHKKMKGNLQNIFVKTYLIGSTIRIYKDLLQLKNQMPNNWIWKEKKNTWVDIPPIKIDKFNNDMKRCFDIFSYREM